MTVPGVIASANAGAEVLRRGRYLSFLGCKHLADVSALGAGLGKLQALTSLHLSRCLHIAHISAGPGLPDAKKGTPSLGTSQAAN